MPSPSRSSPLPQGEPNEYQSYTQQEESVEVTEAESTTPDLYYGTEALLNALPRIWTRGLLYVLIAFAPWLSN